MVGACAKFDVVVVDETCGLTINFLSLLSLLLFIIDRFCGVLACQYERLEKEGVN